MRHKNTLFKFLLFTILGSANHAISQSQINQSFIKFTSPITPNNRFGIGTYFVDQAGTTSANATFDVLTTEEGFKTITFGYGPGNLSAPVQYATNPNAISFNGSPTNFANDPNKTIGSDVKVTFDTDVIIRNLYVGDVDYSETGHDDSFILAGLGFYNSQASFTGNNTAPSIINNTCTPGGTDGGIAIFRYGNEIVNEFIYDPLMINQKSTAVIHLAIEVYNQEHVIKVNPCLEDTHTVDITIDQLPLNIDEYNYTWYGPTGFVNPGNTPTITFDVEGVYHCEIKDGTEIVQAFAYVVERDIVTTVFNNLPVQKCSGEEYSLPTTSSNGITGIWSPAYNNETTTTYTFTPDDINCATVITKTIEISEKLTPQFEVPSKVCIGDNYSLPTTSKEGVTGNWTPAFNNLETTEYTFIPDTEFGCASTTSYTINIDKVVPTFTQTKFLCYTEDTEQVLPGTSNEGITGTWTFVGATELFHTYLFKPNAGQCAVETPFNVTFNPLACDFPKGISPNGDGNNDFLDLTEYNVAVLKVYNRYGKLVYEKDFYKNEWYGQNNSGEPLPHGTYYYTARFIGVEGEKTQWIQLMREVK